MLRQTHRLRLPPPLAVAAAEAQRLKAVDKQLVVVVAAPLPRDADRRLAVAQVPGAVARHRKAEVRLPVAAVAEELQLPLLRRNSPMEFT